MLTFISIIEVLLLTVPVLLIVAFVTIAERKTMASMQRRLGPNYVGYYGLLQAFADALKLLLKEYIAPTQSNLILFFLGPIITLIFSLLGYIVIPYSPGLSLFDSKLGILYMLAVSSLATYGILIAGWSANSKYAFLGSLRSTAQLISYELILSSAILLVVLLTGDLSLGANIEAQKPIMYLIPLFPAFVIFFIGSIAETNRAPFDLAEAESELVSGFMTEHSAVIFVFFFLAEYASIVLICILNSILFLGGYLNTIPLVPILVNIDLFISIFLDVIADIIMYIYNMFGYIISLDFSSILYNIKINKLYFYIVDIVKEFYVTNAVINKLAYVHDFSASSFSNSINLAIKSCILIFIFIWARASLPRIRFDQLMSFCWTVFLPIVISFIILVPCLLYGFDIIPNNISLL